MKHLFLVVDTVSGKNFQFSVSTDDDTAFNVLRARPLQRIY